MRLYDWCIDCSAIVLLCLIVLARLEFMTQFSGFSTAPYNCDRWSYMVHNGCVFRDHHVVVQDQLRSQLLNKSHHMHTGVECIQR